MCEHPARAEHVLKKKFSLNERRYLYKTMARKRSGVYTVGGHKQRAQELFQHLHESHSQAHLKNISKVVQEKRQTASWLTRGQIARDHTSEDAELIFSHASQREHPAVPGLIQWLVTQDQESCARADEEHKGVESTNVLSSDDALAARRFLKRNNDAGPSIGDVVPCTVKAASIKANSKAATTKAAVERPKAAKAKAKQEKAHLKCARLAIAWAEQKLLEKPASGPLLQLLQAQMSAMEEAKNERSADVCTARVKAAKAEFNILHRCVK